MDGGDARGALPLAPDEPPTKRQRATNCKEVLQPLSASGLVRLVELHAQQRLSDVIGNAIQRQQQVHAAFMQEVTSAALPSSDGRSADALESEFQRELQEYLTWHSYARRSTGIGLPPPGRPRGRCSWYPTVGFTDSRSEGGS